MEHGIARIEKVARGQSREVLRMTTIGRGTQPVAAEAVYVAIKRRRSTRAEVERRRRDLFDVVVGMKPMTVLSQLRCAR